MNHFRLTKRISADTEFTPKKGFNPFVQEGDIWCDKAHGENLVVAVDKAPGAYGLILLKPSNGGSVTLVTEFYLFNHCTLTHRFTKDNL
jgi:hypothetical protein